MPPLKRTQSATRQTDSSMPTVGDRNSLHDPTTAASQSESSSGGTTLKKDPAITGSLPDIMIREKSRKKDSMGVGGSSGSKSHWYIGDSTGPAPLASREVSKILFQLISDCYVKRFYCKHLMKIFIRLKRWDLGFMFCRNINTSHIRLSVNLTVSTFPFFILFVLTKTRNSKRSRDRWNHPELSIEFV